MTGPSTFCFLNKYGSLEEGWDNPKSEKLWVYNLHYFDDLNAQNSEDRRAWHDALIKRWISENPPGQGSGWEPYPTSLRIVNWVKYSIDGPGLDQSAEYSLAVQARWLMRRLEWHLLGNHLFANAKALVFLGVYFDGPEAEKWRTTGLKILKRELPEQLLPDGGHFELSPMYHALMVEDLLDLLALVAVAEEPSLRRLGHVLREALRRALRWLAALTHPDGGIAFFNDAAMGVAPDNAELMDYAMRLGLQAPPSPSSKHLVDSGYLRLELGTATLLADLARIGPDYLPGHAHADTLSFELSYGAQRVVVNSGTSVYGLGAERLRQRGTGAHSTVTVAEQDSSEVWSGFRVGRRARVTVYEVQTTGVEMGFAASHDGYRALPGAPRHSRQAKLTQTGLRVVDQVSGNLPAQARYFLHPDVSVTHDGSTAQLTLPNGEQIHVSADGPMHADPSSWHPEFGLSRPSTCLVLPLVSGQAGLTMSWTLTPA